MIAKIGRRIRKMESMNQQILEEPLWENLIQTRLFAAHDFITSKWQDNCESATANIHMAALTGLRPERDLDMDIPILEQYLADIIDRESTPHACTSHPTSDYPKFAPTELPYDLDVSAEYTVFRLMAMETWIDEYLTSWTEQNQDEETTCGGLRRLMEHYYSIASVIYAGNPISMSIM